MRRHRGGVIAALRGQHAHAGQSDCAPLRDLAAGPGERPLQPGASLGEVAADLPEPPEARRQAQLRAGTVRILVAPPQRRAQVVVVLGKASQPRGMLGTREESRPCLLDQRHEPIAMAPVDLGGFAGLDQAFLRIVANGFEHAIPGLGRPFLGHEQRLVDKASQQVDHLVLLHGTAGRDGLGRLEGERASEGREPRKEGLLGLAEHVEAPVHGGAQRAVPGQRRAAAAGQQAEPIVQPRRDLVWRQGSDPRCRELDRQRDAVQSQADLPDRVGVLLGEGKSREHRAAAVDEELHGIARGQSLERLRRSGSARFGQRHRRHGHQALAGHAERLAAGCHDAQVGAAAEELVRDVDDRVEQVLAVVQDQEHAPVGERGQQCRDRAAGRLLQLQRRYDRVADQRPIRQRAELDVPDTTGVGIDQVGPDFQREPGLSDATRPGEGEDRGGGKARLRIGDLLRATDEAGELVRQVVRKRFERSDRGKFRAQLGPEDLVQPYRRREILEPMLPEIAEAHLVRYRRADQRVGRLREKDLAAVAGSADARGAVDVDPDVARDRVHRFARVQAHSDPHVGILWPLVVRDRSLRVDAGQQRRPRGREGDEQAVARGVDVAAAVRRDGFADEPMVVGQQGGVRVAELLEEARRPIDVREEQADRPGRQRVGHHWWRGLHHHPPASRMSRCRTRPATVRR